MKFITVNRSAQTKPNQMYMHWGNEVNIDQMVNDQEFVFDVKDNVDLQEISIAGRKNEYSKSYVASHSRFPYSGKR